MGHKVTGLCLSYQQKNEGWTLDGKVRWKSINTGLFKIFGLIRFIANAGSHAKKADIIWACSDSFYGIVGYLLSIRYGVPTVFDLYDNFEFFLAAKLPIMKQLYRWSVRKCAAVTCVSRPLAVLVGSYGRKNRIFVLENAVRKELFMPMDKAECRKALKIPQHIKLVGTAGGLSKHRGVNFLLEAFNGLKDSYPALHLAVAGRPDVRIPENGSVHNFGMMDQAEVPLLINALDVAVICNLENDFGKYCFPQKAREIMACNIPLIAARVGSMQELLANHPEWLFMPDSADDLARVLIQRFKNPETGYRNVPSWSYVAQNLARIMEEICSNQ
jgi:glycosyltransferase involved in cell wall biosynthesis